jgi:hypothetical protein
MLADPLMRIFRETGTLNCLGRFFAIPHSGLWLSHFEGVAVGDGLIDAAGAALEPGLGVALEIARMPCVSGVSIVPNMSASGRRLRSLVAVQRSSTTPPMRILERPDTGSVSTIRTTLPGRR